MTTGTTDLRTMAVQRANKIENEIGADGYGIPDDEIQDEYRLEDGLTDTEMVAVFDFNFFSAEQVLEIEDTLVDEDARILAVDDDDRLNYTMVVVSMVL